MSFRESVFVEYGAAGVFRPIDAYNGGSVVWWEVRVLIGFCPRSGIMPPGGEIGCYRKGLGTCFADGVTERARGRRE